MQLAVFRLCLVILIKETASKSHTSLHMPINPACYSSIMYYMTALSMFLAVVGYKHSYWAKQLPIVDPEGQAHPNQLLKIEFGASESTHYICCWQM